MSFGGGGSMTRKRDEGAALSGQSVGRALTRLTDLTAEVIGSVHGTVAAAVRGVLRLGRDR